MRQLCESGERWGVCVRVAVQCLQARLRIPPRALRQLLHSHTTHSRARCERKRVCDEFELFESHSALTTPTSSLKTRTTLLMLPFTPAAFPCQRQRAARRWARAHMPTCCGSRNSTRGWTRDGQFDVREAAPLERGGKNVQCWLPPHVVADLVEDERDRAAQVRRHASYRRRRRQLRQLRQLWPRSRS